MGTQHVQGIEESLTDSEIPAYLSDEYFRLREQEKAYRKEARHYLKLAYQARTLEEALQLFELVHKTKEQEFALAWRTLQSMAQQQRLPEFAKLRESDDPAGEFELLLTQEQRDFPVQGVSTLWTEDDSEVKFLFWLRKEERSQEELEEQIDSFLGNLERKSQLEITKQNEINSLTGINCTAVFSAQKEEPQ